MYDELNETESNRTNPIFTIAAGALALDTSFESRVRRLVAAAVDETRYSDMPTYVTLDLVHFVVGISVAVGSNASRLANQLLKLFARSLREAASTPDDQSTLRSCQDCKARIVKALGRPAPRPDLSVIDGGWQPYWAYSTRTYGTPPTSPSRRGICGRPGPRWNGWEPNSQAS